VTDLIRKKIFYSGMYFIWAFRQLGAIGTVEFHEKTAKR
jgi:hypothetical protein